MHQLSFVNSRLSNAQHSFEVYPTIHDHMVRLDEVSEMGTLVFNGVVVFSNHEGSNVQLLVEVDVINGGVLSS